MCPQAHMIAVESALHERAKEHVVGLKMFVIVNPPLNLNSGVIVQIKNKLCKTID